MRIGTWNVEYARGASKNQRRHELIAGANADVWVLTETHDDLRPGEGWQAVSTTGRPRHLDGGRWVTIWTRLEILEVVATSDPCRTAAALVRAPSGPLLVYGTVMPWHTDKGVDPSSSNWSEHHRVIPEQAADWQHILAAHPGATLCVAGDLNTTFEAPGYGTAKGRALLRDALAAADLTCLTAGRTASDGRSSGALIDHVCVSRYAAGGAQIVSRWPGTENGVRLSDHPGVVVSIPHLSVPAKGSDADRRGGPQPACRTQPMPGARRLHVGETLKSHPNPWSRPEMAMAMEGPVTDADLEQMEASAAARRSAWRPSLEGLELLGALEALIGCHIEIQLWHPMMIFIEEEAPYPMRVRLVAVERPLGEDGYLAPVMVVDDVTVVPTEEGHDGRDVLQARGARGVFACPVAPVFSIRRLDVSSLG